ncbi:MAG: DUF167 domain-containing protein [Proteobacteria bacterium]|nr:DUF167 domain-containing protein [Pseudomonadota bacterium]
MRQDGHDLLLACKVQPRATHNAFGEVRDGELVVKLHAPPVDGKANDGLVRFLAEIFGVASSRVRIERGNHSRHKVIRIERMRELPAELISLGIGIGL